MNSNTLNKGKDELGNKNTNQDEDGDSEVFQCESGYENCDHDDFESMSDDCKQARAEAQGEAYHDTYD